LSGENVESLGSCETSTNIGVGQGDGVGGSGSKFNIHVIACVSSTDAWGVLSSLSSRSEVIIASSSSSCGKSRKCLEIQSQLTNIIRNLADGIGASSSASSGVGTGIVRVSDVGGVGGDGGTAGGGGNHTANSKASSTITISTATLGCTFRACVAGSICGCGAGSCTLLVGKLHDGKQGKCLCIPCSIVVGQAGG